MLLLSWVLMLYFLLVLVLVLLMCSLLAGLVAVQVQQLLHKQPPPGAVALQAFAVIGSPYKWSNVLRNFQANQHTAADPL
jgi:hypothetical protein